MNIEYTATVMICALVVVAIFFTIAFFVYEGRGDEVRSHRAAGSALLLGGIAFVLAATSTKPGSDTSTLWWLAGIFLVGGVAFGVSSFWKLRNQIKARKNA
jgi:hypothetical protein